MPGLDVDLDHGDVPGVADERIEDAEVGAIGVRQRRQRVVVGRLRREPARHVGRQVEPEHVRRHRDVGEREVPVGHADDADAAVAELEIGLGHLELVARDPPDLVLQLRAAPATAPDTITEYREPPGPVPGSAFCESA